MKRIKRLNSLLKEVISEVVTKEVKNPNVSQLISITRVDISRDLKYAKVFVSIIGHDLEKNKNIHKKN